MDERIVSLTITEVIDSFGISETYIIELIDEGVLLKPEQDKTEWQFDERDLCRIRTVLRLERDLGVNLAGSALALELLDEIERLNERLLST